MIKRLNKSKKSKQGAILVIVVLILALAMIFIASAMMLTQATRRRLYSSTLSNQARLTVTAASEVFLEALEMQEITDTQIDKILAEHPARSATNADKMKMIVPGVPGMGSEDDNCTYLDIYKDSAAGSNIIYCDLTTIIGDSTENVRVVLEAHEDEPTYGGRFKNQIDIATVVNQYNLRFTHGVGMAPDGVDTTGNSIVIRGDMTETASEAVYYCDIIYAKGTTAKLGGGNNFHGKMIFLEGAYFNVDADFSLDGDIYFIGKPTSGNGTAGFQHTGDDDAWDNLTPGKIVAAGRTLQQDPSYDQNQKVKALIERTPEVYILNNKNEAISVGNQNVKTTYGITSKKPVPESVKTNVNKYKQYDYTPESDPYPGDLESVLMMVNPGGTKSLTKGTTFQRDEYRHYKDDTGDHYVKYNKGTTVPEDMEVYAEPITTKFPDKDYFGGEDSIGYKKYYQNGKLKDSAKIKVDKDWFEAHDENHDGIYNIEPGWYQLESGEIANNDKKPYVFAINGAKASEYRFWFKEGTYNMRTCVFAVYNVKEDSPVIFVMEPKAVINLSGSNFKQTSSYCAAGFISVDRGKETSTRIGSYVRDTARPLTDGGEAKNVNSNYKMRNGTPIRYSTYYDSKVKPVIYIYGAGRNEFNANSSATVEAYIGLYGDGQFGGETNMLDGGYPTFIYGRIEANKFKMGNSNGGYCMPYCPGPNEGNKKPDQREAESKYKTINIIYYYQDDSVQSSVVSS